MQRIVRRSHRSLSVLFTIVVVVNIISAALSGPVWIGYVAIPPIVLLLVTGLYLFALPYRARRSARA